MQRAGSEVKLPLVGFSRERQRVAGAVSRREPLVLFGPPGSGKTRLAQYAFRLAGASGIFLAYVPAFHELLAALAVKLLACNPRWSRMQTSVHLKGLIWKAVESSPRFIILDGIQGASAPVYRFFQRVYHSPGVTILATARDPLSLGALCKLFWDPRQSLFVRRLDAADARSLFDMAADRFGLWEIDIEDFRTQVLDSAQGNPGQIIEMCRLAGQPAYLAGRHVKFAPLRIDVMTKFLR